MTYAVVREDLKGNGTEASVSPVKLPLMTAMFFDHMISNIHDLKSYDSADLTIPDSAYPLKVLHQGDDGLVYLLLNGAVVVGQSIDFDYVNEVKA